MKKGGGSSPAKQQQQASKNSGAGQAGSKAPQPQQQQHQSKGGGGSAGAGAGASSGATGDDDLVSLFTKPVSVSTQTRLQNSACRRFKDQVMKNFPSLSEADVDSVLPKKAPILTVNLFISFRIAVLFWVVQPPKK